MKRKKTNQSEIVYLSREYVAQKRLEAQEIKKKLEGERIGKKNRSNCKLAIARRKLDEEKLVGSSSVWHVYTRMGNGKKR